MCDKLDEYEQTEYKQDIAERDEYIFNATWGQLKTISLNAIVGFIENNHENFSAIEIGYYKNVFHAICLREEIKNEKTNAALRCIISELLGGD